MQGSRVMLPAERRCWWGFDLCRVRRSERAGEAGSKADGGDGIIGGVESTLGKDEASLELSSRAGTH